MQILPDFTVLAVGLSGLTAQVILMRELLVTFSGNELSLGIILANWVLLEAGGVFIIGRVADRVRKVPLLFTLLNLVFSLGFPFSIYCSRALKSIFCLPYGEIVTLPLILASSFLIMLPVSFTHGGLFSAACKIYTLRLNNVARSTGRVYAWETIGTLIGGLIVTYVFTPHLNSFQIAFTLAGVNLLVCLPFFKYPVKSKLRYTFILLIAGFIYLSYIGLAGSLHRDSIKKQWQGRQVLAYQNSAYGNLALAQEKNQFTFFYNGIPVLASGSADRQFLEDFSHLPLLFFGRPKDVLVIGQGASGLISELLKHPVVTIDYVELDPAIMDMFRVYRFGLTQKELNNKRLNLINQDARLYLRAHPQRYDVILVGLANQADLATNRFFTREFFLLAKEKLNPQGIFSFWLEGSLTYINQELKDINGCIFNSLKAAFRDIRIVPGDYNIFIAGKSAGIADIDAQEVWRRKIEQGIETAYLQYNYLAYRMDRGTLNWFRKALRSATAKSNRDLMPFAVFKMMQLNNKKFSPRIGAFFAFFEKVNLKNILLLILSVTLALACFLKRLRRQEFCLAYGIFTSGFFGLLSTLILIFSYQVFYSRLYHKIGILISVFMAGAAFGSLFIGRRPAALNNPFKLFIRLDFLVAAFSLFLGLLLTGAGRFPLHFAGFTFLFFCSGLFIGLQFPLANKIFLRDEGGVGRAAGLLYAADLLGGCLAGMFTGIVFLPLLGVLNTCLLAFALKLSSAFLLVISRKS